MSIRDEMLLDLVEVTKAVYNDAYKNGQVVFDNERGFIIMRPDHGPNMTVLYLHIKNKYYLNPMPIPHTMIEQDKFEQLCASLDGIVPRNIMRITVPKLWSVTTAAA